MCHPCFPSTSPMLTAHRPYGSPSRLVPDPFGSWESMGYLFCCRTRPKTTQALKTQCLCGSTEACSYKGPAQRLLHRSALLPLQIVTLFLPSHSFSYANSHPFVPRRRFCTLNPPPSRVKTKAEKMSQLLSHAPESLTQGVAPGAVPCAVPSCRCASCRCASGFLTAKPARVK